MSNHKRVELLGATIQLKPGVALRYCMNENCEEVIGRVVEWHKVASDFITIKFQPTKVKKGLDAVAMRCTWFVNAHVVKGGYDNFRVLKGGPSK